LESDTWLLQKKSENGSQDVQVVAQITLEILQLTLNVQHLTLDIQPRV